MPNISTKDILSAIKDSVGIDVNENIDEGFYSECDMDSILGRSVSCSEY